MDRDSLKLIYVLKIGYNSKGDGLYEFIFSNDITNIDIETWCWDMSPAVNYARPPEGEYVDKTISLKTNSFDLICLHEAVDREYMHGYHTIHALAYETDKNIEDGFEDYDNMFEDNEDDGPLLVFHYGMSLNTIIELFDSRKIILNDDDEFVEVSSIKIK